MATRASKRKKQRTIGEVRRIVQDARASAKELDNKEKFWHEVENGTFDYESRIPPVLGPPVVVQRRGLTGKVALYESVLSWPWRVTVDLADEGTEQDEDLLEAYFQHCLNRADQDGTQFDRLRSHMVRSRYGALWVSIEDYLKPQPRGNETENSPAYKMRLRAYESNYWRYKVEALNPATVGFIERAGHVVTAVLEDRVSLLKLCDPYTEAEADMDPLEILNNRYPEIKTGDGKPVDGGTDLATEYLTRYVIDDGEKITCYVDGGPTTRPKMYAEPKVYPNTLGVPSLILFKGVERPHDDAAVRFEAIIGARAELEYRLTMMESISMTVAANPNFVNEVPEEIQRQINDYLAQGVDPKTFTQDLGEENQTRDRRRRRRVPTIRGQLKDVSHKLGPEFELSYNAALKQEEDMDQQLLMLNPPPEVIEKGTSAAIFAGIESGMRSVEKPLRSIESGRAQFFRMVANDQVVGVNPHLRTIGSSKAHDTAAEFRIGKIDAGKLSRGKYTIKPELFTYFPSPAVVSTEIVPGGEAQKAARIKLAMELHGAGYGTAADVLEARGVQDITAEIVRINAEKMSDYLGPGIAKLAMLRRLRFIAVREGLDPEFLIQMMLPELADQTPGPQRLGSLLGGQTYNAPNTPAPIVQGAP